MYVRRYEAGIFIVSYDVNLPIHMGVPITLLGAFITLSVVQRLYKFRNYIGANKSVDD